MYIAWYVTCVPRLEATSRAEEYWHQANELQSSTTEQQEEAAKLLRTVQAKGRGFTFDGCFLDEGERNRFATAQLEHVRQLTEEQRCGALGWACGWKSRVGLEAKVQAAQMRSAHILNEA